MIKAIIEVVSEIVGGISENFFEFWSDLFTAIKNSNTKMDELNIKFFGSYQEWEVQKAK